MSDPLCVEQSARILDPLGSTDEYLAARSVARLLITAPTSQRVEIIARLVSGSTVSLLQRVLAGTLSAPLFYRLNVIHLVVARYEAT